MIIQQDRGQFVNANGFNAWQGFDERGYEIQFFDWDQMAADTVPLGAATITVGSVLFVRTALRRLSVEPPSIGYPVALRKYLGRDVWPTSWAEVRAQVDRLGFAVFVKPFDQDKAFTGYVVSTFRDLIPTARWPGTMRLWAADPIPFRSEWRYFVRQNQVIGVGHAKGDPFQTPDPAIVQAAIADYAPEAPIAYAIDFGVLTTGLTHLVEVNEGFSLGCYGLRPLAYSGFLEARWLELVAPLA